MNGNKIINYFDDSNTKTFRYRDISAILKKYKNEWNIEDNYTVKEFVAFLIDKEIIKEHEFDFPYRKEIIYSVGSLSLYDLIMNLKKNSYFSHFTAMYINHLTEQIPKTIYLNYEQTPKPQFDDLTQKKLNWAFKRKPRTTNNIAKYGDYRVAIINGKHTGKLGVIEVEAPQVGKVFTTNIERTLIDITVRPVYAGSIYEVLRAYTFAKDRVSINKLVSILKKLNYVYPYHQAIGFYLEKSGVYEKSQINLLKDFDIKFDFYLANGIENAQYSNNWRLFFPKGF